ncbi:MAG: aquaporin [Dehalococcoidia bacterium]|jgi:aquaporin Z|nr:aquaporin [Dehalococcoidia bacterium]
MDLENLDWRKLVAEAVGSFALIFIGAGSVIMSGGNIVAVALAHGLAIGTMVSAMGYISGGLFNPALTLGLWVTRRLDHLETVAYIIAQVVGAIIAAAGLALLLPDIRIDAPGVHLGAPVLGAGTSVAQAIAIEAILTAFLMLAVFGTALDSRRPNIGGLAIGLVLTMDILAGGPLTGAAMNPARSLGPALVNGFWDDHFVYWVGPIVGAVLAALLYHHAFMDEADRPEGVSAGSAA